VFFINIFPGVNVNILLFRKLQSKAMQNPVYQLEGRISQHIPDTAHLNSPDYVEVSDETVR
jgi:hypothetical protein